MKLLKRRVLFTVLIGLGLFAQPAMSATRHVDCDRGHTIGKALESATGSADRLEIFVSGTCIETVTIRRDDVTISGEADAKIEGTVRVFSSSTVWFDNITISGPGDGLLVSGNADVRLSLVQVRDNEGHGLSLRRQATALVLDSTIFNNGGHGVFVEDSSLQANRSQIVGNSSYGIFADLGSHIYLTNAEVANNGAPGAQVMLHSVIDLRSGTYFHDNLYHDLYAVEDSAIRISSEDVHVEGNIGCEDSESSLSNRGGLAILTDCSGFE
jgi:hypothetical protein